MVPARPPVHVVALVCALVLICFGSSGFGQPRQTAAQQLALVGGTVYVSPTEDPISDGVVLIQDGKITAVGPRPSIQIPKGLRILDCSGLTVAAGFWNSHVHFMERQWAGAEDIPAAELSGQLQTMLTRYGVTSAFDTGSSWENTRRLRARIESGGIPGPRIRSTGEILVPKGGAIKPETLDIIGAMRVQTPEIADVADALAAASKLLDAGADGIKLYAATWYPPFVTLPEDAMLAASEEAHRRGKPVFAHPTHRTGLLAALRGGADILVHTTPQSGAWDETVLSAMKGRGVALIPTLKLWKYELRHDRLSTRERFAGTGIEQLRAWLASGGNVLFGTDVGYMNDYDPTDEYALMAEAGMTFRQILASLTIAPAERFGASKQLGRIAPGFTADLVVLNRDPSRDVRGLGAVRYTIRDGAVIYQAVSKE